MGADAEAGRPRHPHALTNNAERNLSLTAMLLLEETVLLSIQLLQLQTAGQLT